MIPGITSFSKRAGMSLDPHWGRVWALLHCDGANDSTTFTDSSRSPKTVTPAGNAKISTTENKFGGSSAYFDGSGDRLNGPAIALFGDFTFEMFARFNSNSGTQCLIALGTGQDWAVYLQGSSGVHLRLREAISGANAITGEVTLDPSVWYHIAWVRYGGTMMLFLNGAQVGSSYAHGAAIQAGSLRIGDRITYTTPFAGFIDEVRVTVDHARYTGPFSAPSKAFPDAGPITAPYDVFWDRVSLLTNFDSGFSDVTGKTWAVSGSPTIDTTTKKFGSGSLLTSSSNYISSASSADWAFGTGDYTVEAWVRCDALPTSLWFSPLGNWASSQGWCFFLKTTGYINYQIGGSAISGDSVLFPLNQFVHIAYSRNSGTGRLFIDGNLAGSGVDSVDMTWTTGVRIGRNGTTGDIWPGHVDEVRITKGVARYTANFTPPTAPFPTTGP